MSTTKVSPDEVASAVMKALAEYGDEVFKTTDKAAKDVARQASSELKATSPSGPSGYARGWTHKAQKGSAYGTSQVVYNRVYQLVHLLEFPHRTGPKRGGHYPSKVDHTGIVARVEEKYSQEFYQEVIDKL